jgi:hypothetical protein
MKVNRRAILICALWTGLVSMARLGGAATFNTVASADAFVAAGATGNLSDNNFGAAGALAVAAGNLPLGEFQSVIRFDLAAARTAFDSQYGVGQWGVQGATLRLSSSPHNNPIFNQIAPGQFGVSLLQNNSWVEGTGTGGIPTTDGVSLNSLLNTYANSSVDQALGTFKFNFPGGSSGANDYALTLAAGLVTDVINGDMLSLRLFAADNAVSYLFSSRANGSVANRPTLTITATAVPEPSGVMVLTGGLALLLFRRAKRASVAGVKLHLAN